MHCSIQLHHLLLAPSYLIIFNRNSQFTLSKAFSKSALMPTTSKEFLVLQLRVSLTVAKESRMERPLRKADWEWEISPSRLVLSLFART